MKARQRKKNYKKIHGYNPPKNLNYDKAIPVIVSVLKKWVNDVIMAIDGLMKDIKEMSDEEFNEKMSLLTAEQMAIAKIIRHGIKEKE